MLLGGKRGTAYSLLCMNLVEQSRLPHAFTEMKFFYGIHFDLISKMVCKFFQPFNIILHALHVHGRVSQLDCVNLVSFFCRIKTLKSQWPVSNHSIRRALSALFITEF